MDLEQYGIRSMDDLRALADDFKDKVPEDVYQSLMALFGLLPNQGTSISVLLDGEPVDIDVSLAPLIQELNAAGVTTLACCSGRPSEHTHSPFPPISGYLSLPYQAERLTQLRTELHDPLVTVEESTCYLKPSITIVLHTTDEDQLSSLWASIRHALLPSSP